MLTHPPTATPRGGGKPGEQPGSVGGADRAPDPEERNRELSLQFQSNFLLFSLIPVHGVPGRGHPWVRAVTAVTPVPHQSRISLSSALGEEQNCERAQQGPEMCEEIRTWLLKLDPLLILSSEKSPLPL